MHEINSIASNITNEIKEKQNQIENLQINDENTFVQLKNDIDLLKSNIIIEESIPQNLYHRIERTVQISYGNENQDAELIDDDDDDDEEPVIVDFDRHDGRTGQHVIVQQTPATHEEGRISKVLNSQPVQHAIAVSLVKTIAHVGTTAATSTTIIAASTMAKTALIATACGIGAVAYGAGRLTMGATRKVWSIVFSSDD
jgi:hypothetical protein